MLNNIIKNLLPKHLKRFIKMIFLLLDNRNKKLTVGYNATATKCSFGIYNYLYSDCSISHVTMGDFTYIGQNSSVCNTNIGKFCSIGPNCKIGLGQHPTAGFVSTHPIFYSTLRQSSITFSDKDYFEEFKQIHIGNDVWVGADVIVLDGISIGNGAIIGAGSVVTKDVPPYAIVAGVPAKIIKYRFSENDCKYLENLQWWNKDISWLKDNFKLMHNLGNLREKLPE